MERPMVRKKATTLFLFLLLLLLMLSMLLMLLSCVLDEKMDSSSFWRFTTTTRLLWVIQQWGRDFGTKACRLMGDDDVLLCCCEERWTRGLLSGEEVVVKAVAGCGIVDDIMMTLVTTPKSILLMEGMEMEEDIVTIYCCSM